MLPHKLYFYKGSYSFITKTEKKGKGLGFLDVEWEEWDIGYGK
jgi:hypothetical protein